MDPKPKRPAMAAFSLSLAMFMLGWTVRGLTGPNPWRPQLNLRNSSGFALGVSSGSLKFEIPPGSTMGFRIDPGSSFRLGATLAGKEVSREVPFWPGTIPQVAAEVEVDPQGELKVRYRSPDE